MIQCVKDIHRDLIIADQWTEPHSPWQNPDESNGVKYVKSHAQVLLDRTGTPDNLGHPAQDCLSHVHNLSANRQLNWKIPEQVSRGEGETPDISHILIFFGLNLYCIWIQSQNLNFQKTQKGLDIL
jgi:hypothetical protein